MTALITAYSNSESTTTKRPTYNWAFIDLQNLHKGIKAMGWRIDWRKFRELLYEYYNVTKAVAFLGYVSKYVWLYKMLERAGFHLEFKETNRLKNGVIDGGNVDADLTSYLMDHKSEYSKAIIVADDTDYANTILSLIGQNKLEVIISSHLLSHTSRLVKKITPQDSLISVHGFRNMISRS